MSRINRICFNDFKPFQQVRFAIVVTIFFILVAVTPTFSQQVTPKLSTRAQALMQEAWSDSSFSRAMQILPDQTETHDSRLVAMEVLHTNRLKLTQNEMNRFLEEVTAIVKNPSTEEVFLAQSIYTMGNMALTMEELGYLSRSEAIQEGLFLLNIASDSRGSLQVRTQAIVVLGILRIPEAAPPLEELLTTSFERNIPEIARPASLALLRINGEAALPVLSDVLSNTTNDRVFGTAAFALGQIHSRESVGALVENLERFPESGACGNALVDLEEVIFTILQNPHDDKLSEGIRATRYLWKEGQRERYIVSLRRLLTMAPLAKRQEALERLLEEAGTIEFEQEKQELKVVLDLIKDQPQLNAYRTKINARLSATIVAPSGTRVPVERKRKQ